MNESAQDSAIGLGLILDEWARRFVFDAKGRLVGLRRGGVPPRLIFARSAEGCVWRFQVDLPRECVGGVAKLAARERGWPIPLKEGVDPLPPERLVMIARLMGAPSDSPAPFVRDAIVENGVLRAEMWFFD